jgi:hypothetical protein
MPSPAIGALAARDRARSHTGLLLACFSEGRDWSFIPVKGQEFVDFKGSRCHRPAVLVQVCDRIVRAVCDRIDLPQSALVSFSAFHPVSFVPGAAEARRRFPDVLWDQSFREAL